jgi:hypothetical protein
VDWTKVVTDPLGLAAFALAIVFSVVSTVIAQKHRRDTRWIVPAGFALAAVCVLGGLFIAYQRVSTVKNEQNKTLEPATAPTSNPPNSPAAPTTSLKIDKVEQNVGNGAAVSGVQGNVTINAPASEKEPKPKQ